MLNPRDQQVRFYSHFFNYLATSLCFVDTENKLCNLRFSCSLKTEGKENLI